MTTELATSLKENGLLDLEECYIDSMFVKATKAGDGAGIGKKGKGSKIMAITDKNGNPLGISVDSASPHVVTRVLETVDEKFVAQLPEHLIGDAAHD